MCEKADTRIRTADLLFTKHTFAANILLSLLYPLSCHLFRSEICCLIFQAIFLLDNPRMMLDEPLTEEQLFG